MPKNLKLHYILLSLLVLFKTSWSHEVLLIAGGYYHRHGQDVYLSAVEILGKHGSCEVAPLPGPRLGLALARIGSTVVACGGFFISAREDCFVYSRRRRQWERLRLRLSAPSAFLAASGEGERLYLAGGREAIDINSNRTWIYHNSVWTWSRVRRRPFLSQLPNLPKPTSDGCLISFAGTLIYVGGSTSMYAYADDPSKVLVLINSTWSSRILPALPTTRMWHGCHIAKIGFEVGLVLAGGYYEGHNTLFLGLNRFDGANYFGNGWQWLGKLPERRQWGPALGSVDGVVTIAGGKDYGDDSVDEFLHSAWIRNERKRLLYRREFASHVTVPSHWFPECRGII